MILEKLLMPDEVYSSFEELTPEHMKELGKKYIFSDIDNTLATYDDMYPPENVKKWCAHMAENGIKVAFVSNNNLERVEKFNSHFGYAAYSKAGKPKTGKLKLAMAEYGASVDESVLLGDQLLTDAACANRAGMYCIIVPPIKDKKTLFFRFKRLIEKPYMKKFMGQRDKKAKK